MESDGRYFAEDVTCRLEGRALRVANLSPGGLFVATTAEAETGQTVVFELRLPRRTPFQVVAEVTWVNQGPRRTVNDLPEGFGVRFVALSAEEQAVIEDLLKRSDRVLRRRDRRGAPAGAA